MKVAISLVVSATILGSVHLEDILSREFYALNCLFSMERRARKPRVIPFRN